MINTHIRLPARRRHMRQANSNQQAVMLADLLIDKSHLAGHMHAAKWTATELQSLCISWTLVLEAAGVNWQMNETRDRPAAHLLIHLAACRCKPCGAGRPWSIQLGGRNALTSADAQIRLTSGGPNACACMYSVAHVC